MGQMGGEEQLHNLEEKGVRVGNGGATQSPVM